MNSGFRAIETPNHRKRTCSAADEKTTNGVNVKIDENQVDRLENMLIFRNKSVGSYQWLRRK